MSLTDPIDVHLDWQSRRSTVVLRVPWLGGVEHRRDALWQVERAGKLEGPLLMQQSEYLREDSADSAALAAGT